MSNILEMRQIEKSFFGVKVLKGVDFAVKKGEVHALCGENGAGKSTLMKILAGVYEKDAGTIIFKDKPIQHCSVEQIQRLGISMIFQELNLLNELTVAQNIFLNKEETKGNFVLNEKKMAENAKKLLEDVDTIDPNEKVKNLSIAKKQIVEITKSISFNSELIIMDEPTSVLSKNEVDILYRLIRKLKNDGVSIIYISHRLPEIREICDRATVMRDGEIVATVDVKDVTERDIARLMVGREITSTVVEESNKEPAKEVFRVEHISSGDFVSDISFSLYEGEILGFYGLVGAGRSELMETIFGVRPLDHGEIYVHGKKVQIKHPSDAIVNKIAFAPEDRREQGLFLERSIRENVTIINNIAEKTPLLNFKEEKTIAKMVKERLNIKYNSDQDIVIRLSGGNQQKIVFGKWAIGDADIFIFDEPTRGVDIGARKEIYEYINELSKNQKSVIVISSDIPEILAVCQRIIVMQQGKYCGEILNKDATEEKILLMALGTERKKNENN